MVSLEASFLLAYIIRHGFFTRTIRLTYYHMIFVLLLIEFASTAMLRTFSGVLQRGYFVESAVTLRQAGLVTLLSVLYLFSVQEGGDYSRITLFLTGILYFAISYTTRILWKTFLKKKTKLPARSIIVVTTKAEVMNVLESFRKNNYANAVITGIVLTDRSMVGESFKGIKIIADRDTAEEYVLAHWVDEVLFDASVDSALVSTLLRSIYEMGITVHQVLPELQNDNTLHRNIENIGGYTVITRSIRFMSAGEMILKRTMDIAGGIIGCIITGILCIFIGPAIYFASPGPIFFSQDRIGKNGKIFKMYKFRSMYPDAEERLNELKEQNKMENDLMFKMDYDPRIIGSEKGPGKGIGNFIRRTSIDEFPQFLNVLKGDMSLVGTRPPLLSEWEQYENHHRARMAVKPGITGMWQVSGRSNITDFEEVVELDMEYIENWNFGLDIKILIKTIIQVFKHEGAA